METKICVTCVTPTPVSEFSVGRNQCRECRKQYQQQYQKLHIDKTKEYNRKRYERDREEIKARANRHYHANKSVISVSRKKYRDDNKDKVAAQQKRWREANRKHIFEREKRRLQTDPNARLRRRLRVYSRRLIKDSDGVKAQKTVELLGCSVKDARLHVESLWKDGMSWDNYGYWGWHIDHIRPCASFDLTDPAQQRECFHYTNLQPMWGKENIAKGSKYQGGLL